MTHLRISPHLLRLGLAFALLTALVTPGAYAQNAKQKQSLELSPPKAEITMNPGDTATARFGVRNLTDQTVGIEVDVKNLLPKGDSGAVTAVGETTPYELQSWTTTSTNHLTIPSKERQEVTVVVRAPRDASPGGHYGMVRFASDAGQSGSVAVRGVLGAQLLVSVNGDANKQGNIEETFLKSDGKKIGWFFFGSKLSAATRFKNSGNVHFPVSPQFTAENQFGGKSLDVTIKGAGNVLPGSSRVYETPWDRVATGYYTVTSEDSLPGNPNASKSTKVLVVTPRVAGALALILLALVILIVRRRHKRG